MMLWREGQLRGCFWRELLTVTVRHHDGLTVVILALNCLYNLRPEISMGKYCIQPMSLEWNGTAYRAHVFSPLGGSFHARQLSVI